MNLQQQIKWYENRIDHLECRIEDFEWEVDRANSEIQKNIARKRSSISNVNKYTKDLLEAKKHLAECYDKILT